MQKLPTPQKVLEWIMEGINDNVWWKVDGNDNFREISFIVDGDMLQKAAVIIDLKQIKRVRTTPESYTFYEFAVSLLLPCKWWILEKREKWGHSILSSESLSMQYIRL